MNSPGHIPDIRELTTKERLLLELLLRHAAPGSNAYQEQLSHASVVSHCSCGCPTIDLAVRGKAASPGSPSKILAEARGVSPEQLQFGIILHARDGLLSELEVYSIDATRAVTLPELNCIEFWDTQR